MPAPVHNPAAHTPPHMAHTPDPQPPAHTPAAAAVTATAAARPRIRDQIAENPLASFLGAVIIVMLGFTLTTSYDRITRLEDKIDTRFAQVDARFDSLESDVGEINLKLTALIAALNATDPVDAALEGRLTGIATAVPADEPR